MSADSPRSEKLDTRFSTPAPELDDHRHQLQILPRNEAGTSREIFQPTPRRSSIDRTGLLQVSDSLRDTDPIARDFEHVIIDDDKSEGRLDILTGEPRRGSARVRRFTNRQGRPQHAERVDRSRETSSSRSTSPPNSVEAFADPRRRERANTLESRAPSFIEALYPRRSSNVTAPRRPSIGNVSRIRAETLQKEDNLVDDDKGFPTYEVPGKTYKIDYEELEEFVALSSRGLLPNAIHGGRKPGVSAESKSPKIFQDLRQSPRRPDVPSIVMNCEYPYEKPLEQFPSSDTPPTDSNDNDEKASMKTLVEKKERFCLFSSELQSAVHAAELGDFTSDGTTFRDLFELGPEGGVWWLDVNNPTSAELEVIRKAFKIHPMTREDIEQQEAREKVELFSQYYFVCFRTFHNDRGSEEFLEPVSIYIVVCGEGVLSFSFSETPHARNVRKRISKSRDFVNLGSDYICYALM